MTENSARSTIEIPAIMVPVIAKIVDDYAAATGQPAEGCRRLVEVGVLTRGCRAMQVEVSEQRKLAERMGWK